MIWHGPVVLFCARALTPPSPLSQRRALEADERISSVERRAVAAEASSGGRVKLHTLPDSGHWVHIEAAAELLELMGGHLAAR